MAVIKKYNTETSQWEPVVIGQQGFTGSQGVIGYTGSKGYAGSAGPTNLPLNGDKTASYSLVTSDVGKCITVGTGGSITIPNSTFSGGDAISLYNNTTGDITITCSITTAYIGGTDTNKSTITLATRGVATILFLSATICVVTGNIS